MRLRLKTIALLLALSVASFAYSHDAKDILEKTGVQGGLVVHLGCGDGRLTAALRASDSYLVHGLDADAASVEKARQHIQSLELYGKVSVRQWDHDMLPYIDNLVNLIVVERPGKVPTTEILRVLAPNGVACLKQDGNWTKTVKPWPEEIDHWTHSQYDASGNAVSRDKRVGPPRRLQWVGGPKWTRHHESMSSFHAMVSASGRVFYILDEGPQVSLFLPPDWKLIARDAFNGKVLWKQPVGPWVSTMRRKWIYAVNPVTEEIAWKREHPIVPMTLAADRKGVFFHDGEQVVCLDRKDGKEKWRSEKVAMASVVPLNATPTLVVYGDVVLVNAGDGSNQDQVKVDRPSDDNNWKVHRSLVGLSADTGKRLWACELPAHGYAAPKDILVADGLIWSGEILREVHSGAFKGRDPLTGVVKREFRPDGDSYWFHQRCFRSKATERFLMPSRTGVEFVSPDDGYQSFNHWVRGACLYGTMPANGLLHVPPHPCGCYMEAMLHGFNTLAPEPKSPEVPPALQHAGRLEKGPAYDESVAYTPGAPYEWPMYRGDAQRSGFATTPVSPELEVQWRTDLGGTPTAPTIAEGKVFVAVKDAHSICALDAESGRTIWSRVVGGRVDSPPTIYKGRVLFGSADGCVYCLRAGDGQLVWRFRAAPTDRYLVSHGQVESVWPVHGSVLILGDRLYCVAGRSMFLDGGLRLLVLDPATGKKLAEQVLDEIDPTTGKNLQFQFARMPHLHAWVRSLEFHVFAADKQVAEVDRTRMIEAKREYREASKKWGREARQQPDRPGRPNEAKRNLNAASLKSTAVNYRWSSFDPPLYVQAMVLADKTLFLAGPPAMRNETTEEASQRWEGKRGGLLWALSTADGTKLAEHKLDAPPIFDGMAAAAGRLFISLRDGKLICLGQEQ